MTDRAGAAEPRDDVGTPSAYEEQLGQLHRGEVSPDGLLARAAAEVSRAQAHGTPPPAWVGPPTGTIAEALTAEHAAAADGAGALTRLAADVSRWAGPGTGGTDRG